MVISRWITNLEDRAALKQRAESAQMAYDADPNNPGARVSLDTALARLVGHDRTMALIENEHGKIGIGEPMGTEYRTADEIKRDGFIGIYRT